MLAFLLSGCDKQKPVLVMNSQKITKETVYNVEQNFKIRQRINYALLMPKGFKDSVIRVQIIKKEQKTAYWGYKIYQAQDFAIDKGKNYYINFFTIPEGGYYIMRIFELRDLDKPVAILDFWVK